MLTSDHIFISVKIDIFKLINWMLAEKFKEEEKQYVENPFYNLFNRIILFY